MWPLLWVKISSVEPFFVSPRDFILDVASDVGEIVECLFLS